MKHRIDYDTACGRLRPGADVALREHGEDTQALLAACHPDHRAGARTTLAVGPNAGEPCHPALARLLEADALIDEVDLAGLPVTHTDVLVIGGGGAGAAAAIEAAAAGADVMLVAKLRIGDSNTVMAEGGIQAAVGSDDSIGQHYNDTLRAGHGAGRPDLVARLTSDGPEAIRWLIGLGAAFDLDDSGTRLARKRAGGTRTPRILSHRDFTGLEIMRVLRETVELDRRIAVLNRAPAVELLTDDNGACAGAVLYEVEQGRLRPVLARAVVLATGGAGRLHLEGFATSNHYGATADGLVIAYRAGARLTDVDSFQYHPTGIAWPRHLAGGLVSEAARSLGARLVNGLGERFVDELAPRDVVAAAILRECENGRGIGRDGVIGVFLDTPDLLARQPDLLRTHLLSLAHLAKTCGIDPAREPLLVYPTLHYQNGGVVISPDGLTGVPGLYAAGEVTGGIHGRNRLMGNALLDIIAFGRRAGRHAAAHAVRHSERAGSAGLGHLSRFRRALAGADRAPSMRAPLLYPEYGNFELRRHMRAAATPGAAG
ncbi:FAD-binding protein [Ralstonia pseudosolanacearum]|uniref:FAD-binding protein n=1 Tax=Ralstonia pseudosolanacearum TaxID=1310165 RepID=UPI002675135E|nr:FAD-binding protein [Ralstonia pseudosolanacearum]MDO3620111.1 FAD-binding protein [Ralstonia pseudosolanacearum]